MAAIVLGGFFEWGRAEALLFFAFRPWLLLVSVLIAARHGWRERAAFYALALSVTGLSESLLLIAYGAENPWPEMLRGLAAGAGLAAVMDILIQLGRRRGRIGQSAAAALIVLLLFLPGAMQPYERIVIGPSRTFSAPQKPDLLMMTGLPLVWGETGPFDPASRPAAFYRYLQREFNVIPVDWVDEESLAQARLMLLAQPRALAPDEMVALDEWIRSGGRILVLADPHLLWPTDLQPGDIRRPPATSLIAPLLRHWGLTLKREARPHIAAIMLAQEGQRRRLVMAAPGRLHSDSGRCASAAGQYLLSCRIGRGHALILADADLLNDSLWAGPGQRGTERHARTSDNPLIVAGWLDMLAGMERPRAEPPVAWRRPGSGKAQALLLAFIPIVLTLGLAFLRRRFSPA